MCPKNILLIDDDHEDTLVFIEVLKTLNQNIVCQTFQNPLKALEHLIQAQSLPDILFLDYNMPVVNGLEFLQRLRKIEHLKDIEVIVMSTPPTEVMQSWFDRNSTAVKYVSKPSSTDELRQILQELLLLCEENT